MITVRALEHPLLDQKRLSLPSWEAAKGSEWLLRGVGKTMFWHLLTGLVAPAAGEIVVRDEAITGLSDAERAHVRGDLFGFMLQPLRLLPALTVLENLQMARKVAGKQPSDQALDSAMRAVGVDALASKKARELSREEAQHVAIARATVTDPKILVCQDPALALDDLATVRLMALLRQVCRYQKLTLIIASDDARLGAQCANILQLDAIA
jgi:ABC-type lipoprotein export system ATPase subunit